MLDQIINEAESFMASAIKATMAEARSLTYFEQVWAAKSGVLEPDKIRLVELNEIPKPKSPLLVALNKQLGLIDSTTAGITFGNFVLICKEHYSERLLRHEFRHVQQWNTFKSSTEYLNAYLSQVLKYGYWNAPFEVDARMFEHEACSKGEAVCSKLLNADVIEPWRLGQHCSEFTGFYIELKPLIGFSGWSNHWADFPYFAYLQGALLDPVTRAANTACLLVAVRSLQKLDGVIEGMSLKIPTNSFEFRVVAVRDEHIRYSYPDDHSHLPAWRREGEGYSS